MTELDINKVILSENHDAYRREHGLPPQGAPMTATPEKCPKCGSNTATYEYDEPVPHGIENKGIYCKNPLCKWVRDYIQSPPVARVEVYRKALEVNANRDHGFRCTYAAGKYSGTVPKCTCGKAEAMEALLTSKPEPVAEKCTLEKCVHPHTPIEPEPVAQVCQKCGGSGFSGNEQETFRGYIKEYCLECKGTGQAPVAPVRKWEADSVVGQIKRSAVKLWLDMNPDIPSMSVICYELDAEVQDALRGRKV